MTFGYSSSFKLSATYVRVGWIGRNSYVVFLSEVTILITYLNLLVIVLICQSHSPKLIVIVQVSQKIHFLLLEDSRF